MVAKRLVAVLVLVLAASVSAAFAQDAGQDFIISQDADYFGFDLRAEKDVSLDQCKASCLADPACRAFTYNTSARWCFLKSDFNTLQPFAGAIAGRVVAGSSARDIGAAPDLGFVSDSITTRAAGYRDTLGRQPLEPGFSFAEYRARANRSLQAGDYYVASGYYKGAIRRADSDVTSWLGLARSLSRIEPNDADQRRGFGWETTLAAYNAYRLTRTRETRADALGLLGLGLEKFGDYRRAESAYRAGGDLGGGAELVAAAERMREKLSLRIVRDNLDTSAETPRFCAEFSDGLARAFDFTPYVTVNGAPASSLSAQENRLCVEGLEFGKTYEVVFREGLPSADTVTLRSSVSLRTYVPDRKPYIRFTGENFVLPAHARQGIPVVTMNFDSVKLKLLRVSDRTIAEVVRDGRFLRQLSGWNISEVEENQATEVWQGRLDIASELNAEVTTSFPVSEVLPDREPGIYILSAVPEDEEEDRWEDRATQWFLVSDIGLMTYSGDDGLNVFVRSLADATPRAGIALDLVARDNDVLGTATTDADGRAHFDAGLIRGAGAAAPALVLARAAADFAFLDLTRAGFDLSDRGVAGRPSPGAVDVYSWTERGIYRVGETVHAAALLRDSSAEAVEDLPLTFVFTRPDGVEERRIVSSSSDAGGHVIGFDLTDNAMRGTWYMRVYTDPKAEAVSEQMFLVEDFVPDRIEFDLTSSAKMVTAGEPAPVTVDGRYLYGAPATGLALEGEVNLAATREDEAWPGYFFGLADEKLDNLNRITLSDLPLVGEDGKAEFGVTIGDLPATTQLLTARLAVRMREAGGRAVERRLDLPIRSLGTMIGIRPKFDGNEVREGSTAEFGVIAVDPSGERQALAGAKWSLVRLERRYHWYRTYGSWNYEAVDLTVPVGSGTIDISADGPAEISHPVDWGRYRLEVSSDDADGPATSVEFHAGWYVEASSTETPDGLEIALDKAVYAPGDVARLRVSPRFAGEVLVAVGGEELRATHRASVPAEGATIDIPVSADWGAGTYVTATLLRPGNREESRMPMRAIGVKWLAIDPAAHRLGVSLDAPKQMEPNSRLEIPIAASGLQAGDTAYVTVAAVDVGILNLTRYQAPDPEKWYFGQRRLGLELRDLYGRLIDGYAGVAGRIRSGGDGGPAMAAEGSPPTEALVAFFSGPVKLDADGRATVGFDIPAFNGTVRIMAVAWSGKGVGHATSDVVVREPVVVTASMPQFLAPGDVTNLHLDIANTDGPAGDYALALDIDGPVELSGALPSTLSLAQGGRRQLAVPVSATGAGQADLTLRLTAAGGRVIENALAVAVRAPTLPQTERMTVDLAPNGGSVRIDTGLLDQRYLPGATLSVAVGHDSAFDIPGLLMTLDRYPYGCAEQTTSRALPLLYVGEMSALAGMSPDPELRGRVQKAIRRVLSYQSAGGGFGLWGPGNDDMWLTAYVTDFLTRAREKDYDVPEQAILSALDNLQNRLAYGTDIERDDADVAYALYVLARNRKAPLSDLKYYAESKLSSFRSPMARAQLAAALALYGDTDRANRTFAAALEEAKVQLANAKRSTPYGSRLRDSAALVALAAESRPQTALLPEMLSHAAAMRNQTRYTSTQEQAWMLLAARAISAEDEKVEIDVNGTPHSGRFVKRLDGEALAAEPLVVTNRSGDPLKATITTVAAPVEPLPAGGDGFAISRDYYRLDGSPAVISSAEQNERFVVVIKVTQQNDDASRIVVTDMLPAGLQIDNPKLVDSAELAQFDWLGKVTAAHSEFRTDRFVAAFNRDEGGTRDYTVAYVVRAVTPGVYTHPAATVEDMYRPHLSARTATGWMEVGAAR